MGVHPVYGSLSFFSQATWPLTVLLYTTNTLPSPTPDFSPNHEYSGPSSMCGRNATKPLFPVKTLKIEAGSTIGFGVMPSNSQNEHLDKRAVSSPYIESISVVLSVPNLVGSEFLYIS